MPAMPPPRITTDLPAPTLPGQSPGRGDCIPGGGGGGGGAGGFGAAAGAAEDDPQAASEVPIPIAAIVRSIAELPTALPIAVRNSRRLMSLRSDVMPLPYSRQSPFPENILQNSILLLKIRFAARSWPVRVFDSGSWSEFPVNCFRGPVGHMHNRAYGLFLRVCPIPEPKNNARSQD